MPSPFNMTMTELKYSELHVYRGHQPSGTEFIMGHEFTGTVHELGSDVKTLQQGDSIVCPFTTSWWVVLKAVEELERTDNDC
jgi:threonine dehydrogenase-like Zn-dependent dehydrogenase